MLLHRLVITSLVALSATANWAPLAAQSATQDTTGSNVRVVSAPPSPSTPSIELTNAPSIERTVFLAPAWTRTQPDARQLVPTAAVSRAVESSAGSRSPAMMIVGGAGLIVGALIGGQAGTIIMVGGGLVGLVGLWNYLK